MIGAGAAHTELDPLSVGKILGQREVVLDAVRLRSYIDGVGAADNPWYGTKSPYGVAVYPPGTLFYEAMSFPGPRDHERGRAAFNSGIGWRAGGPLRLADKLDLVVRISDRWTKRGREFAVLELEAKAAGRLVGTGQFKESWDRPPAYDPPLESRDGESSPLRSENHGPVIAELSRRYTLEMSCAYAGDIRNIHTDRELAAARGFKDVVIAGPQLACQASELLTRVFGRGYLEGGEFEVNLLTPVVSGEAIRASVAWLHANPSYDAGGRGEFCLFSRNDEGRKVLGGIARVPTWDLRA